jgi:hypothetical protein
MCCLATAMPVLPAYAQEGGSVRVPLSEWQAMTSGGGDRVAPASLGVASVRLDVHEEESRFVAEASATFTVRAPAEGSRAVVLPAGTIVESVTADGTDVALASTSEGLAFVAESAGTHHLTITYSLDGVRSEHGASVALPLPPAPSVHLTATLPPEASDIALVPGTRVHVTSTGGAPSIEATVPGGGAAQLAWRTLDAISAPIPSRARYHGVLVEGPDGASAVRFDVELGVELASDAAVPIALFPTEVALGEVTVDGHESAIRVNDEARFAAIVSGHGHHTIHCAFSVPLGADAGLPSADLSIPEVPISRFEIELPPGKDLTVTPEVAIERTPSRGAGARGELAVFHVPLTSDVHLAWPEALPDEAASSEPGEVELRASATLVHVLRAEEGILRGRVHAAWDVSHGSTSRFDLTVPPGVDVGAVHCDVATVADWRVSAAGHDARALAIFLDREVSGPVNVTIDFDVLRSEGAPSAAATSATPFAVPLLGASGVWRQSGMLALLATHDLVLEPTEQGDAARVGENQLPPEVRAEIDATIAHVFRWTSASPEAGPPHVLATVSPRPHEAGRFDARIDTLVSLGDVTTTASAAVDVHVKSGTLTELRVALPPGANVLEVSAPSLREHRVEDESGTPIVHLWFTQEMEGDLRVELRWERMGAAGETTVAAPIAHVEGADVEQGRVAVEATAAAEVSAQSAEGLSPMDVGELPDDLVLRSASPILLAFRYAHATPAPALTLTAVRHAEVTLRDASIDEASYRTLVTDDGLAVTTATWTVRNGGQQFLRIALPEGAEVWAARVQGRSETPAIAEDEDDTAPTILVTVPRSTEPFAVELTYATPVAHVGLLGRVSIALPRPDLLVSHAHWEVDLPAGAQWGNAVSDLSLADQGVAQNGGYDAFTAAGAGAGPTIRVPAETMRFVFDDVFVGEGGGAVTASFPYASGWGVALGWLLAVLGALAAWLGVLGLAMARAGFVMVPEGGAFELATYRFASAAKHVAVSRRGIGGLAATALGGLALAYFAVAWLGASPLGPIALSMMIGAGLLVAMRRTILARLSALRARIAPPPAPFTPAMAGGAPMPFAPTPMPMPPPAPPTRVEAPEEEIEATPDDEP